MICSLLLSSKWKSFFDIFCFSFLFVTKMIFFSSPAKKRRRPISVTSSSLAFCRQDFSAFASLPASSPTTRTTKSRSDTTLWESGRSSYLKQTLSSVYELFIVLHFHSVSPISLVFFKSEVAFKVLCYGKFETKLCLLSDSSQFCCSGQCSQKLLLDGGVD